MKRQNLWAVLEAHLPVFSHKQSGRPISSLANNKWAARYGKHCRHCVSLYLVPSG